MVFFEWYVGVQRLHLEDVIAYKTKTWKQVWEEAAPLRKKMRRQVLKDYVFFPLIAGPNAIPVFTGNAVANVIRSLWASAVIFNGHFTEDAETFEMDNTDNEPCGMVSASDPWFEQLQWGKLVAYSEWEFKPSD